MNVGDLFLRLSYGELSNLALGQSGTGVVLNKDQGRIVTYANAALIELYSRFIHKRSFVDVELQEDVTIYRLSSAYAVSQTEANPTKPHYLKDTIEEPFEDDVIKIISYSYENKDPNADPCVQQQVLDSIRRLSFDSFKVTAPKAGAVINIEYQAKHAPLSLPADRSEMIYLAPLLWSALDAHICAAAYSSMNGEANAVKAQGLSIKYESLVAQAKQDDLLQEMTEKDNDKLQQFGWR